MGESGGQIHTTRNAFFVDGFIQSGHVVGTSRSSENQVLELSLPCSIQRKGVEEGTKRTGENKRLEGGTGRK